MRLRMKNNIPLDKTGKKKNNFLASADHMYITYHMNNSASVFCIKMSISYVHPIKIINFLS